MNLQRIALSSSIYTAPARAGFILASILVVTPVDAIPFKLMEGDVSGALDTTLSYGAMWRVQGQDKNSDNINSNDGNRNYDTGLVSQVYKITSELSLDWENFGLFTRGTAFYDAEMMGSTHFGLKSWHMSQPSQASMYGNRPNNRFTEETKDVSGKDAQLLDAYLYGFWDIMGSPVDVRVGKQVLSWGEGIFYRNGINTTNPMNAPKFHLPGSELKEALIPVETFSISVGLTENLSASAFYQWNFRKTVMDPAGTFFSETDLFPDGGNSAYNATSEPLASLLPSYPGLVNANLVSNPTYFENDYFKVASIGSDIDADDDGQFGVSFRYIAEELNDTEFGFYFVNYHGKNPVIFAQLDEGYAGVDLATLSDYVGGNGAAGAAAVDLGNNLTGMRKYVGDIRMYGFSFNTNYRSTAFAGEISYRPNMPVFMATTNDLIGDTLDQAAKLSGSEGASEAFAEVAGQTVSYNGLRSLNNYERVEHWSLSLSAVHHFGSVLSFDSLFGIMEVASEHLRGSSLKYTAYNGEVRRYNSRKDCAYRDFASGRCEESDQISRNAWGYTAVLSGIWNNAYGGITLNPYVRWSQSVSGNSHSTGNFIEDARSVTVGMTAQYMDVQADVQYTEFNGPSTYSQHDRDNIAIGVKYYF